MVLRNERAEEVKRLVESAGRERCHMLTLTISHGLGHDLKVTRKGIADAYRRLKSGAPWKRFKDKVGYEGDIRALEVTYGSKNGWHPHLHILMVVDDGEALADEMEWLTTRWKACVRRALGKKHEPSSERGAVLTSVSDGTYLSKLGLADIEMTDAAASKGTKNGNRTPLQIANDFYNGKDPADLELWKHYAASMKGARFLTWSLGLKDEHGISDRTDEEVMADTEKADGVFVGFLTKEELAQARAAEATWDIRLLLAARVGPERFDKLKRWLLQKDNR